jgi:hypothetical protein
MWIKSRLESRLRRAQLRLEFRKQLLDRLSRSLIRFGLQHAPIALDVEPDDLDFVHGKDLNMESAFHA